jgi:hypothetical protein
MTTVTNFTTLMATMMMKITITAKYEYDYEQEDYEIITSKRQQQQPPSYPMQSSTNVSSPSRILVSQPPENTIAITTPLSSYYPNHWKISSSTDVSDWTESSTNAIPTTTTTTSKQQQQQSVQHHDTNNNHHNNNAFAAKDHTNTRNNNNKRIILHIVDVVIFVQLTLMMMMMVVVVVLMVLHLSSVPLYSLFAKSKRERGTKKVTNQKPISKC